MADRDERYTAGDGRLGRDGEPQTARIPADSGRGPEHRRDDVPAGHDPYNDDPYNDDVQNDATVGGEPTDRTGTDESSDARSTVDSDERNEGHGGGRGRVDDERPNGGGRPVAAEPRTAAAPVVVADSGRTSASTVQVGKPLKPAAGLMGAGLALLLLGMVLALVPPVLVNMLMPMMGAAGGGPAMQIVMAVMVVGYVGVFIGLILVAMAVVRLVRLADLKARQINAEADVVR
ncbi:hypothetical protein [Zhihengliuella sp.]|uniref:hypothetical protein n=1 Tax=Zhihengliuella sp. TaxID=1954483 RepID=UPI002811C2D5|nr:hypothetical protein [Zhihengliuella sp.]